MTSSLMRFGKAGEREAADLQRLETTRQQRKGDHGRLATTGNEDLAVNEISVHPH